MPRVVIAAGGTAGHVVPAIAVADALRGAGAAVSFAGTRGRAEAELVPAAGYEIDFLRVSGLDRRNPLRAAVAVARAAAAIPAAGRLLADRGADAVLGGGGYISAPVGLAATRAGIPLVVSEADSHLGLSNRLLARRASRVCLAFPIEGRTGDRYVITGRPVPRAVLDADRAAARRRFGVGEGEPCVAVIGGSLGARSINLAAFDAFAAPAGGQGALHVVHVSGRRDYDDLRGRLERAGEPARYELLAYEPNLGDVLAACDLVVARAGGSVFEIAARGRPAVLIPYPHATADHQGANARWMADAGAAVVIEDGELSAATLGAAVGELLADEARLARMASASASLARLDAAERVAAELLATIPT